jgi:hypothetical protein
MGRLHADLAVSYVVCEKVLTLSLGGRHKSILMHINQEQQSAVGGSVNERLLAKWVRGFGLIMIASNTHKSFDDMPTVSSGVLHM